MTTTDLRHLPKGHLLDSGSAKYRIIKVLGKGGFGITYLATDEAIGLQVAIKEFYPHTIASRENTLTVIPFEAKQFKTLKGYFLEEARELAKYDNPGILKITSFFEANNTAYIIMPFLKGDKLSERVHDQIFSEPAARKLFLQLIQTLKVVHANGALHRDIKPDNIIYDIHSNTPILIDFGSSQIADKLDGETRTLGTYAPHFSPIELSATGTKKSAATDIYSLGATIYRAMFRTGPPESPTRFEADDECLPELAVALEKTKISKEFASALRKCLELRSKDRFQSLGELEEALTTGKAHILDQNIPGKRKPAWLRRAVSIGLIASLIGGGVWYYSAKIDQNPIIERTDGSAWQVAQKDGTIIAYRDYLKAFPSGAHKDQAQQAIADMLAADAKAKADADLQAELDAWDLAIQTSTHKGYQTYLSEFPNGNHARDARIKIDQIKAGIRDDNAWDRAQDTNTIIAYRDYLKAFPNGAHKDQALLAMYKLIPSIENKEYRALVREIQTLLAETKCYYGTIDGLYGKGTQGSLLKLKDAVGSKCSISPIPDTVQTSSPVPDNWLKDTGYLLTKLNDCKVLLPTFKICTRNPRVIITPRPKPITPRSHCPLIGGERRCPKD